MKFRHEHRYPHIKFSGSKMFCKFKHSLERWGYKAVFIITGIISTIWFLIRVIPKPSRANYPCMRVAAPLASSFVIYLMGITSSIFFFRKARQRLHDSRFVLAAMLVIVSLVFSTLTFLHTRQNSYALPTASAQDVNSPIGEAKGIFPGRVAWVHNPDATNENCTNSIGDGWFLPQNNNQDAIDKMLSDVIELLTSQSTTGDAWTAIFQYYNQQHGKGAADYASGEKILIKTNATSAWYGNYNLSDLSVAENANYGIAETSPHVVLAVLRQLVNVVGVSQSDIFVGDPMKHVYKHCYDLLHAEFQDVHYIDPTYDSALGRYQVTPSSTPLIYYSDHGAVLHTGSWENSSVGDPVTSDYLYSIFQDIDYMINIPALKAHARAGVTMFAKNHFGSHCREDAKHLHNGLVNPDESNPATFRFGYGLYRVQVDLMGHQLLGGKNLVYLMDATWAGSEAVDPPTKWRLAPFDNDWTSSLFASQDPVAIESVGFDFLYAEYNGENGKVAYPHMDGVDDYLHQAADPSNWPSGIQYDPENDGTVLTSLGTHEHWNNATEKHYSRNLGTGNGIELLFMESVVPVELSAFYAHVNENSVELTWQTESETNNYGFQIERRQDDTMWQSIAFISGHGTTTIRQVYHFTDSGMSMGSYAYRLKQIDTDGTFYYSPVIHVQLVLGLADDPSAIPDIFMLHPNYPNPFNASTTITFDLPNATHVILSVYNIRGENIMELLNNRYDAGNYAVTWNAGNISSGIYIIKLQTQNATRLMKCNYVK
ncbi:DUF362 domain-containing protein [candidate division KSB1 bacterium]|nr:DUF362 domain-containing protein [candidate division KSB1 bacterium]